MSTDPKPTDIHPDAPRQKSPLKWMALMMVTLIVLTITTMWGDEKISIKASPVIPQLSASAEHGRTIINTQCAECHGVDGTGGSRKGPPILHSMYRAEIFPNFVFKRSVLEGKREKNWRFGPMPAMPELSEADVNGVIAFVREVQTATGIE